MKKRSSLLPAALCIMVLLFAACKKDYIIGGTKENVNQYSNITTYDYLKSSTLYDTLIQLIDTAGLKDKINEEGTTFFAPSDFSVYTYLNHRSVTVQLSNADAQFGLDSMFYYLRNNIDGTRDSLLMYLIKQPLPYSALTDVGAFYPTELAGDTVIVSYEYTKNTDLGYNTLISNGPQVVYYSHLWYPYDLSTSNPASDLPTDIGIHTLVKTSGIITKNGIVNALENTHILFFYGTKQ